MAALFKDKPHDYITVGRRRWCRGCNTFQAQAGGVWRDGFKPGPWPGYEATKPFCSVEPDIERW